MAGTELQHPKLPLLSQSGTGVLLVKTLTSLSEMEAYSDHWLGLEASSTAPMVWFQGYHWCHTWMKIHGGKQFKPHVFLLFRSNQLVAVWPLMRERGPLGVRILRNLGEPHSQYANILTRAGNLADDEADILREALRFRPGADSIIVNLIPDHSGLHKILPENARLVELQNEAAHLDIGKFRTLADFQQQASKKVKRSRRRGLQMLTREGDVSLQVLRPGSPNYVEWTRQCIELKKTWISRTGRISMGLGFEDHAAFLSRIPASNNGIDGPCLFAMLVGKKPIAFEIGFLQRGHYYSYMGSFIWRYRDTSPGKLQMELTLGWLIDNGVKTFDLLANPSGYKEQFSDRGVALSGHAVSLTATGRIYSAVWARSLRPALRKIYNMLPVHLRVGVSIVRKLELSNCA